MESLMERAKAALRVGFTSEAAKKDVRTYMLGRAFEKDVHNAMTSKMLAARDAGDDSLMKFYYEVPMGLYQWRDKHAALLGKTFPEEVKLAGEIVALAEAVKAAPLVKKVTKASVKKDARLKKAMTCQICGRPILADTGVIAHHGYERPGSGWQTASCYGARHLPYEADRSVLKSYLVALRRQEATMAENLDAVATESIDVTRSYHVYTDDQGRTLRKPTTKRVYFNRETFSAVRSATPAAFEGHYPPVGKEFDYFLQRKLDHLRHELGQFRGYIAGQQKRYNVWHKLSVWKEKLKVWVPDK